MASDLFGGCWMCEEVGSVGQPHLLLAAAVAPLATAAVVHAWRRLTKV
ncbi:hypothetical protein [Actinomadura sp. HBU206391]|nr:hypothetical protein [Actinomadura sp. HBU206391]MBC6457488.1 hypothetical protein [Actinomadura sp. HBU206391]